MDGNEQAPSPTGSNPNRRSTLGERMQSEAEGMSAPYRPRQCASCLMALDKIRWTCRAFPGGIPLAILMDRFDHRLPYPGDGGITWTPDPRHPREQPQPPASPEPMP